MCRGPTVSCLSQWSNVTGQYLFREANAYFAIQCAPRQAPKPTIKLLVRNTPAPAINVRGQDMKVAEQVPPYRITTVELKMNPMQAKTYNRVHRKYAPSIAAGADSETGEGRMDTRVHRMLCHATMNPELQRIADRAGLITVKDVNQWSEGYNDFGATWYHQMTRSDQISPPYSSRVDMALYMSAGSVKLLQRQRRMAATRSWDATRTVLPRLPKPSKSLTRAASWHPRQPMTKRSLSRHEARRDSRTQTWRVTTTKRQSRIPIHQAARNNPVKMEKWIGRQCRRLLQRHPSSKDEPKKTSRDTGRRGRRPVQSRAETGYLQPRLPKTGRYGREPLDSTTGPTLAIITPFFKPWCRLSRFGNSAWQELPIPPI